MNSAELQPSKEKDSSQKVYNDVGVWVRVVAVRVWVCVTVQVTSHGLTKPGQAHSVGKSFRTNLRFIWNFVSNLAVSVGHYRPHHQRCDPQSKLLKLILKLKKINQA